MRLGVLLSPQLQKQRRHHPDHDACPMNLRVAGRAERDHKGKNGPSRYTVVNDDGSFVASGGIAHTAPMTVPFEHFLAKTSKVFFILPLEGIADGTHPVREHLRLSTPAMHHVLFELRHRITRSASSSMTTSTSQP